MEVVRSLEEVARKLEEVGRRLEEVEIGLLERVVIVLEAGSTLAGVVSLLELEMEKIEVVAVVSGHVFEVSPYDVVEVVRTPKVMVEENLLESQGHHLVIEVELSTPEMVRVVIELVVASEQEDALV